jgi:hypothetical protein
MRKSSDAKIACNLRWSKANPELQKDYSFRARFGVPIAHKWALLEKQGGVCAICGTNTSDHKNGWHTDHDHDLPKGHPNFIRGILCYRCNFGLACLGDNRAGIRRALTYLETAYKPIEPGH